MGSLQARRGEARRIAYTKEKRIRTQRNFANSLSALGKAYAANEGDEDDKDDENPTSGADPGGETAPESFKEAVEDPRWRESMQVEIKALRNRGV